MSVVDGILEGMAIREWAMSEVGRTRDVGPRTRSAARDGTGVERQDRDTTAPATSGAAPAPPSAPRRVRVDT